MTEHQRDPPKPRGRPVVEAPLSRLSVRVPPVMHDRLARIAIQQDRSVSAIVRQLLARRLP